ncbi:MAG: lipase secretion chaperone [Casimicrobium sp.]
MSATLTTHAKRRGVLLLALGAIIIVTVALVLRTSSRDQANSSNNKDDLAPPILGENPNKSFYQDSSNKLSSPNYTGAISAKFDPAPSALLKTPSFARTIEDLIGDAFGSGNLRDDPHGFRARLAERVRKQFSPELAAHAIAFINRYLNYLESLDAMNLPSQAQDAAALRSVFETRQAIRQAHFSPEEYEVLFARDDRLDRYTIARFEIQADTKLTPAEKTEALNAAANELTPDERNERARMQAHLALQRQTETFDKKQTSDEERFAERAKEHGEAAAQRLAELDRARRDWDARLAQYETALNANRNGTLANEELAATRNRLFNEREQLRLEAALALRKRPA